MIKFENQFSPDNLSISHGTEEYTKGVFKTRNGEMTKWRNDEIAKWRNGTKDKSHSYKV